MFLPPDKSQYGPAPGSYLNYEPSPPSTPNQPIPKNNPSQNLTSNGSGINKANTLLTTNWGSSLKV
jgi:hypothetical protein